MKYVWKRKNCVPDKIKQKDNNALLNKNYFHAYPTDIL